MFRIPILALASSYLIFAHADFSYIGKSREILVVCTYTDSYLKRDTIEVVSPRLLEDMARIGGTAGANGPVYSLNNCRPINAEIADRVRQAQLQILRDSGIIK